MRLILLAATALAMLSGVAFAQRSVSGSSSDATATTTSISHSHSNSHSSSRSAAVGNSNSTTINVTGYTGTDPSGSAADPAGTARSEQYIGYGGGYTVRNTPEVIPPSVVGGNACAVGASGGLSTPGFGIAMGATWADKACERRQQAALLFNMGEQKVALELMCQDDNVRTAMKVGGKPCSADLAVAQAPAAAPTAQASASPIIPPTTAPARPKPEWCAKAAPVTDASKAYVAQVCGN